MASPVVPGTMGRRPFINQFVEIVHEDILVTIDKHFRSAQFKVTYHIKSLKDGVNIPFLFYAFDYQEGWTVSVDGKEISTLPTPKNLESLDGTKFSNFNYFFANDSCLSDGTILAAGSVHTGFEVSMTDMIYFESDISRGEHTIEVSYKARPWEDRSDWMCEYSFRYALSPAQYWKSFGSLTVTIDATACKHHLTSNLNPPDRGTMDSIAIWHFDKLPVGTAEWTFQSPKTPVVKTLTDVGPFGWALISGIILAIFHYFSMRSYRKRHPTKQFSWPFLLGIIIVPACFIFIWINAYHFIDYIIGKDASRQHGYIGVFALITYPFILLVYSTIFWLIDRDFKQSISD